MAREKSMRDDAERLERERIADNERLERERIADNERLEREPIADNERLERERIEDNERLERERIEDNERLERERIADNERLEREYAAYREAELSNPKNWKLELDEIFRGVIGEYIEESDRVSYTAKFVKVLRRSLVHPLIKDSPHPNIIATRVELCFGDLMETLLT